MTVGFTFWGQFLDHDITLEDSPLPTGDEWLDDAAIARKSSNNNLRSPFLDLDGVYGPDPGGIFIPADDPVGRLLYDRSFERFQDSAASIKFLMDRDAPWDVPRNSQLRALIGDPRNDENLIVSQFHLAFLKLHNRVMDHLTRQERAHHAQTGQRLFEDAPAKFREARKLVRWHYQYITVEQYLKVSLDTQVYDAVRAGGPTLFRARNPKGSPPKLPREFQVAAFRFGHSQVRPGYAPNRTFGAPIFDATINPNEADPNDLRGGVRAPRRFVEWDVFFDFGTLEIAPASSAGGSPVTRLKVKPNKAIDTVISTALFELPVAAALPGVNDAERTLAGRNLLRHIQFKVPSGQGVAAELGYPVLSPGNFPVDVRELGFHENTPLWYYILLEAQTQQGGARLGKVGSRIIAEVFFGLLERDPNSYWCHDKNWVPVLPRRTPPPAGGSQRASKGVQYCRFPHVRGGRLATARSPLSGVALDGFRGASAEGTLTEMPREFCPVFSCCERTQRIPHSEAACPEKSRNVVLAKNVIAH